MGADALDLGAHFVEETAEVLDVRFGGGKADSGFSGGGYSGHDGVFGAGYAEFGHGDFIGFKAARNR